MKNKNHRLKGQCCPKCDGPYFIIIFAGISLVAGLFGASAISFMFFIVMLLWVVAYVK